MFQVMTLVLLCEIILRVSDQIMNKCKMLMIT